MPGKIKPPWTRFPRADAVLPPKAGDEVAAGVSDRRYAEFLNQFNDVFAKALGIRTQVVWFVQAVVDAPTQMFHERTEQPAVDGPYRELRIDSEMCCNHFRLS
jgi:hypothetical protein